MHLLIPFAFIAAPGCAARLRGLALPHLASLLTRLQAEPLDTNAAHSLSPPHERALARSLGLAVQDGLLPWAALAAVGAGLAPAADAAQGWAFVTPCHWQVGTHQVTLRPGDLPGLPEADARALLAAAAPYFAEDGLTLHLLQPQRWLAQGPGLRDLPTASLDRVAGRAVDAWLPCGAQAAPLRRLQTEMQMLFYTHPVNEARSAQGLPAVNALWFSGTGELTAPPRPSPEMQVLDDLRAPALASDWEAWGQAWQALDTGALASLLAEARAGRAARLTLCGDHSARSWAAQPRPIWQRIRDQIRPKVPYSLIEQL